MTEKDQPKFSFHFVTLEETLKGVALLSDKKAPQASDGPVKMIEKNRDLIAYFYYITLTTLCQVLNIQLV